MKVNIFLWLNFTKGTGEMITWKAVEVVTMTEKSHQFF